MTCLNSTTNRTQTETVPALRPLAQRAVSFLLLSPRSCGEGWGLPAPTEGPQLRQPPGAAPAYWSAGERPTQARLARLRWVLDSGEGACVSAVSLPLGKPFPEAAAPSAPCPHLSSL